MARADTSLDERIVYHYTEVIPRLSIERTAAELGVGPTWVRNALIRNGVPLRRRGGVHHFLPQEEVRRTIDLYQHGGPGGHGMLLREVAEELDRAESTIGDRLQQAGVKTRTAKETQEMLRRRAES